MPAVEMVIYTAGISAQVLIRLVYKPFNLHHYLKFLSSGSGLVIYYAKGKNTAYGCTKEGQFQISPSLT